MLDGEKGGIDYLRGVIGLTILLHFGVDGSAPVVRDIGIGFVEVFVDAQVANGVIEQEVLKFGKVLGIFKGIIVGEEDNVGLSSNKSRVGVL